MSPSVWRPLSKPRQPVSRETLYCWENPKCHSSICTPASLRLPPSPRHLIPLLSSLLFYALTLPYLFFSSSFFPSLTLSFFAVALSPDSVLVIKSLACSPPTTLLSLHPSFWNSPSTPLPRKIWSAWVKSSRFYLYTALFVCGDERVLRGEPPRASTKATTASQFYVYSFKS